MDPFDEDEISQGISPRIKMDPIKFGDPELSDVALTVLEGDMEQEFQANKMILANSSDIFKEMFYGEQKIKIKDTTISAFKSLLEVIYSGKPNDIQMFTVGTYYSKSDGRLMRHKEPNKTEQHDVVASLWKSTQDVLQLAERYNVAKPVLSIFQDEVSKNICGKDKCFYCLNLFLFSQAYRMPLLERFSKFKKSQYELWSVYAEANGLNLSILFRLHPTELRRFWNHFF